MSANRQCFWIMADQFEEGKGYIPSLVTENEAGHQPFRGGIDGTPYYWGKTYQEAKAACAHANETHFGLSPEEALDIVLSSMRAGDVPKWKGGVEGS